MGTGVKHSASSMSSGMIISLKSGMLMLTTVKVVPW